MHFLFASGREFNKKTKFEGAFVEEEDVRALRGNEDVRRKSVLLVRNVCLIKEELKAIREPMLINELLKPSCNRENNRIMSPCVSSLFKAKFASSEDMLSRLKEGG